MLAVIGGSECACSTMSTAVGEADNDDDQRAITITVEAQMRGILMSPTVPFERAILDDLRPEIVVRVGPRMQLSATTLNS